MIAFAAVGAGAPILPYLARIKGWEKHETDMMARIASGDCLPMWVMAGGDRVGVVVLSTEIQQSGLALIVNALSADPVAGVCVATEVLGLLRVMARETGVTCIRFWTQRPGLVRLMEAEGFSRSYVMEMGL